MKRPEDFTAALDKVVAALGKLPPMERAVTAKTVVVWMQTNLKPVAEVRREAVVQMADEGATPGGISAAIGERRTAVNRLLTEGRAARRAQEVASV